MNITNILIYLIAAAVVGWVATEIMHKRSDLVTNIIVAVIGAFIAGYFLSPLLHVGTINNVGDFAGFHHPDMARPHASPLMTTQSIFMSNTI